MPTPEDFTWGWRIGSRVYAPILNGRNAGALGIGAKARAYFRSIGIGESQIFPFAYFPNVEYGGNLSFRNPIVYVGQLIERKGIDLMLKAFAQCKPAREKGLNIVGTGPDQEKLQDLSIELGISGQVSFVGPMRSRGISEILSKASCLILPSRFDGWGVVVNEAIGSGIPVIASDACGAAELVRHGACGYVFKAGDLMDLASKLSDLHSNSQTWIAMTQRAEKYYNKISPGSGALYFLRIVSYLMAGYQGDRPVAPWLTEGDE
jgi:glycosyltransferase involved in cell wall biosynthesis